MTACSAVGCDAPACKRGMCGLHYQRWWKHGDAAFVPLRSYRRDVRDRLYARTVTIPSGCVEKHGGSRHLFGYPLIQIDGRVRSGHRVAYELARGPIPEGMCVLHRCDNPSCLNPDHLFLGTQVHNMRDRFAKGRVRVSRQGVPA